MEGEEHGDSGASSPIRPLRRRAFWPVARDLVFLAVLATLVFAPIPLSGQTTTPTTALGFTPAAPVGYPGVRVNTGRPAVFNTFDPAAGIGAGLDWDVYSERSLRAGVLPFWNPYQGLGQPFLAEGGTNVLYPLNWVRLALPVQWWDLLASSDVSPSQAPV